MTHSLVEATRLVVLAMDGHLPMDESLTRLRDSFERHEQRDGFAEACWSIDDVLELRPEWSDDQARDFLVGREGLIQDAMVEAGWVAIEVLLSDEEEPP